jgi:hypothetical protein
MKKLLKIISGLAVAIALAIGTVFYFTAGMVSTADDFFAAVKAQDLSRARTYLSEDFKASTDEAALQAFLSRNALLEFKDASWSNRSISGRRGNLDGEVTTESGGVVPLELAFVKEGDAWKIFSIQRPVAGLRTGTASPDVPPAADQVVLVRQSMHDFAMSVNAGSMQHFFGTISSFWQRQTSVEKFDEAFHGFYDAGIDLIGLDNIEPTMNPATALGKNGVLVLEGSFSYPPGTVTFTQKFIHEGLAWKLLTFEIHVVPS